MSTFSPLKSDGDLKEIIHAAFDAKLDISGDWGYTQSQATVIHQSQVPITQFEHMFASMRAYVEMNMTQEKHLRYGSINLNESGREQLNINNHTYHKVTYTITSMKEDIYASFINAYKEGYGKESFDIQQHFKEREESTLTREVTHWFDATLLD